MLKSLLSQIVANRSTRRLRLRIFSGQSDTSDVAARRKSRAVHEGTWKLGPRHPVATVRLMTQSESNIPRLPILTSPKPQMPKKFGLKSSNTIR